jgi:HSP20 family protein
MGGKHMILRSASRKPLPRGDITHPLVILHDEVNRLRDGLWRELEGDGSWPTSLFGFPRLEVSETDREVKVVADMPGMDEKDVELLLNDNVLVIRGVKKSETQDRSHRVSERFYGRFERRIALPGDVQEGKSSAIFQKGVLTITLPKSVPATQKVKRIPINGR